MGFSVSGSLAIVTVGALIALSMAYTAGANGFERVNDAREGNVEQVVEQENTAIEIASTTLTSNSVQVTVNNTGASGISVNATDILLDNTYATNRTTTVETADGTSNSETDLWLPGEQLVVEVGYDTEPSSVTVVTVHAIADREVL